MSLCLCIVIDVFMNKAMVNLLLRTNSDTSTYNAPLAEQTTESHVS